MKKAIVFDNSGTLLERYRVIKDVSTGELFTDVNSLHLIDSMDSLALVVLQFNTNCLLNLDSNILISDVIKKYNIDFDVSFTSCETSVDEIAEILENENQATICDITDGFPILKQKIPRMELCNGSAVIIDIDKKKIAYTITSAGKLFSEVKDTVEILHSRGIEIYIASGDRKGAINKLAEILNVSKSHAFGTVSPKGKCKIVQDLKNKNYKVMMVGDGLNDILAFNNADVSVLTIEQEEEVSPKLINKTDYVIEKISEIIFIDF
ncbi:HAD family hydrolase [uncultured Methanobrevibacter sp.]|uniref:HAD family hydrolase n=1 Tax=uncultured Methanobrevibacter sp. TaxID=253161 RepID=UPI002616A81E|nr:HAD family hydrolase [uncultured Methanobrevibacter sp.]